MDEERTCDPSDELSQESAIDPSVLESEIEERLASRIAQCRHTLEHIQSRLTRCWGQLNKMQEAFKHDPLP
jgi:primosomal protein N''